MKKVYNFSAGPAVLPTAALENAQAELLNYHNSGMSVMELSHRSSLFLDIIQETENLLRRLMAIPDNYEILFLQGGASLQFTMIPLNLAKPGDKVCYIDTGSWSKKAITEAQRSGDLTVKILASSADENYTYIPEITPETVPQDAKYVHITTNNTIEGTSYHKLPNTGKVPIIADMSSNILSNNYNVNDFGLIYAGAQKNLGPAGLTLVIIRKDLLNQKNNLPPMLDYTFQAKKGSLYNTPPTFSIYMAKLVLEWLEEIVGVATITKENQIKSQLLYDAIEKIPLFNSPVEKNSRSLTNIPFITGNPKLDKLFISEATEAGLVNIKGHRSVGGMRASLYNAFPEEGVKELVTFMENFAQQNGGINQ